MRKLAPSALLLSVMLTGCSSDIVAIKGGPICNNLQPVTVSRRDVLTDGTKKSVAGTNAVIETWCGERPIAKEPPQKVASNP
jgi:hypothetical protein